MRMTTKSQYGGSKVDSAQKAKPMTIAPQIRITKAIGPSPVSSAWKSRPQFEQEGAGFRKPVKSLPWPQRGQTPARPAAMGERVMARALREALRGTSIHPPPKPREGQKEKPSPGPGGGFRGVPRTRGIQSQSARVGAGAAAPDVDEAEQEQPDHVHEMPVPGRRLEAEVM